jgi:hypothetical protein
MLWLNDGKGLFSDSGISLGDSYATAVALGDLDGEHGLDAFLALGETFQESGGGLPNQVWLYYWVQPAALTVPLGSLPVLDGTLSPGEWGTAAVESFQDGSELFLMQAEGSLYLGVRALDEGMIAGNAFIYTGDEIVILHTSAALGTAVYRKGETGWQLIRDFEWCCRSTGSSQAAVTERKRLLEMDGWLAANGRMGTPNEMEYRIDFTGPSIMIAVVYISSTPPYRKVPWPSDLMDDCILPTPGGFPLVMNFRPETWMRLELTSESAATSSP